MGSLEKDMEKALQYGKLACELNIPQSCANIARMYKLGDGIPKDPDLASHYLEKAKVMIEFMKKGGNNPGYTG
jgi:cytochrome c oxidase assembly factor 7